MAQRTGTARRRTAGTLDGGECGQHAEWMTRENMNEDEALASVVGRLTEKFPDVPQPEVASVVEDARHHFDDAKVRDFVPVLVEREARDRLIHDT
jgi:hypothetical protein